MEIFVINMRAAVSRRRLMEAQLDSPGMPPHRFIDAVDGATLNLGTLAELYDDAAAKKCLGTSLTRSEVGCAVSHFAVVLEDDALLGHQFPIVLNRTVTMLDRNRPQAVLLCHVERYSAWGGRRIDKIHRLYRPYEAYGAHAYIITLAGAQAMLSAFPRIQAVADDWMRFKRSGTVDVFAVVPYLVGTSTFSLASHLSAERSGRESEARLSQSPLEQWAKRYLWRRLVFQLTVRPALRLRRAQQTW